MTDDAAKQVTPVIHGALARFPDPAALMEAAEKVHNAGFTRFDCHSPFPIHGMDRAMGLKRSPLGWVVGLLALAGGAGGLGLQWWSATIAYPLVISGKPFFSYQAFVPVTFGCAVLLAALGAVFGMFHFNRLPRMHHPVFYSETFRAFSSDGFFVSIEAEDDKFGEETTVSFLKSIGASEVELLKG